GGGGGGGGEGGGGGGGTSGGGVAAPRLDRQARWQGTGGSGPFGIGGTLVSRARCGRRRRRERGVRRSAAEPDRCRKRAERLPRPSADLCTRGVTQVPGKNRMWPPSCGPGHESGRRDRGAGGEAA